VPSAEKATARLNAIAEDMKEIAIIAFELDDTQAAKDRAELEQTFATLEWTAEMLHESDFYSITMTMQCGTVRALALDCEGFSHVSTE
jgi:hypothetical protein